LPCYAQKIANIHSGKNQLSVVFMTNKRTIINKKSNISSKKTFLIFFQQVGVVIGAKFIGFENSIKSLIKTDLSVTKPVIKKYFCFYLSHSQFP